MLGRISRGFNRETSRSLVVSLAVLAILLIPWFATDWHYGDVGARVEWEGNGWVVAWVDPAGPAAAVGLRAGDRVVSLDGAEPALAARPIRVWT